MVISNVVMPRGAISGTKSRSSAEIIAVSVERPSDMTPTVVKMVSGVLLNENIPFFAQSIFLIKLFVDGEFRPLRRSG